MRGFYAMHNTKTPFVINVIENILNIFFAYVLVGRYGVKGLAWSFSIAYLLSALLAYWVLSLWSGGLQGSTLVRGLSRLALGCVLHRDRGVGRARQHRRIRRRALRAPRVRRGGRSSGSTLLLLGALGPARLRRGRERCCPGNRPPLLREHHQVVAMDDLGRRAFG